MAIRRTKPAKNDSHVTFSGTFSETNADFTSVGTSQTGTANVKALGPDQVAINVGCQRGVLNLETARALGNSLLEVSDYAETMVVTPKSGPHFVVEYRDARGATQTIGPFVELEYIDDEKSPDFDTVLGTWAPWSGKTGKEKIAGADFIQGIPKAS